MSNDVGKMLHTMSVGDCIMLPENGITWTVTRVPGGWIYSSNNSSVFVPYDAEGKPRDVPCNVPF